MHIFLSKNRIIIIALICIITFCLFCSVSYAAQWIQKGNSYVFSPTEGTGLYSIYMADNSSSITADNMFSSPIYS